MLWSILLYLRSECIEKYQFEPCSKYDREYDFDLIFGQVVPCSMLRWICCKHSHDVERQVKTPGESTIVVVRHDFHVA